MGICQLLWLVKCAKQMFSLGKLIPQPVDVTFKLVCVYAVIGATSSDHGPIGVVTSGYVWAVMCRLIIVE